MPTGSSVLVVDQDEAIRQLMTDVLQDEYEVRTASNTREAADLLHQ